MNYQKRLYQMKTKKKQKVETEYREIDKKTILEISRHAGDMYQASLNYHNGHIDYKLWKQCLDENIRAIREKQNQ